MAAKTRRVSLKLVGEAIDKAVSDLEEMRPRATPAEQKRIDLFTRKLRSRKLDVNKICIGWWCDPSPKGK